MIIVLFILDIFIYNLTPYNIPLFILELPNQKSIKYILVFFLMLSFFEIKYLITLLLVMLLYLINNKLNNIFFSNKKKYIILLLINYSTYFLFYYLIIKNFL